MPETVIKITVPIGIEKIGGIFCGCGSPESSWEEILKELERSNVENGEPRPEFTGLWYIMAYLLADLGLTEHGSSVRFSWLTDSGKDALAFLKKYGVAWRENKECEFYDSQNVFLSDLS